MAQRICGTAGPPKTRETKRNAIISSPSANASTSSASERRNGRPVRRLRTARTATPARQAPLTIRSCVCVAQSVRPWFAESSSRLRGPKPPKAMPEELEPDRGRVGGAHETALEARLQPAAREGQEHVQEEHGRKQVEDLPDREGDVVRRPRERRDVVHEARHDHQRPEPALGPPPPRDQAAEDVGERDPVREQRDHERLAQLGADRLVPQREDEGGRAGGTAGERERPERGGPRRSAGDRLSERSGRSDGGHRGLRPAGKEVGPNHRH